MTNEKDRDCENHECITYGGSKHPCRLCLLWEIADLLLEKEKAQEKKKCERCERLPCGNECQTISELKAENKKLKDKLDDAWCEIQDIVDEKIERGEKDFYQFERFNGVKNDQRKR